MRLHIATPCHESWDAMTPRIEGRHCASCDRTVVDLTALPCVEAHAAMQAIAARVARGDRVCVRAHAARDGALAPVRARRRLLTNALAAMLAMSALGGAVGCTASTPDDGDTTTVKTGKLVVSHPQSTPSCVMGDMAVEPPPVVEPTPPVVPPPTMGESAVVPPTPVEDPHAVPTTTDEPRPGPRLPPQPVMGLLAPDDARAR